MTIVSLLSRVLLAIFAAPLCFVFVHGVSNEAHPDQLSSEFDVFGAGQHAALEENLDVLNQSTPSASDWTGDPLCSRNSVSAEEYCVFRSTTFASGRGISFLTFPKHAEHLITTPAFTEPNLHRNLGANQLEHPPFTAKQFKDRGIGVVANRTIKRGEWLMSFTPAFITPSDTTNDLDHAELLRLYNFAFQTLPSKLRNLAQRLAVQGSKDLLDDIMITNAFAFPVVIDDYGTEEQYTFLVPEVARFNHDCRPSAHYSFDATTLTLHVIAFRDIFAGEEITITYIDPVQKRRARLKALEETWGFRCHCSLCAGPREVSDASDARIGRILELQEEILNPYHEPEVTASATAMAEDLISLYQKERLWNQIQNAYATAALQYNGIGNDQKAREYAKESLRSGFVCRGPSNEATEYSRIQALFEDPRSHDSWMSQAQRLQPG